MCRGLQFWPYISLDSVRTLSVTVLKGAPGAMLHEYMSLGYRFTLPVASHFLVLRFLRNWGCRDEFVFE